MGDQEPEEMPGTTAAAPAKGKGMWIGIVVVAIVIIILLAAVFGGLFGAPAPPPSCTQGDGLKIGTVLTLTGTSGLEAFGPKNQRGASLAAKEINDDGGVNGFCVVLIHEDDTGADATAGDRANKLVTTDQVDAILGAVGSSKCQAVLGVAKPNSVVQISASCTSPVFTDLAYTGGWFFRTAPSDALQGVVAANYSFNNRSFTDMAVIGNNNAYGQGLANVFATEFVRQGGTARVAIFAEAQPGGYSSDLTALFTPIPEAVYMANYPTDGLQVMRDWAANPAWSSIEWIFSEGVLDQTAFINALVTAGINTDPFEGSAPGAYLGIVGALYDNFATAYKAEYNNQDPGLFTANAYDAVYLLAAAAQKAGASTSAGIKANLVSVSSPPGQAFQGGRWTAMRAALDAGTEINYEGASGAVDLDTFGEPLSGYAIWGTDDTTNQIETLEYFNEATVVAMLPAPPAPAPPAMRSFRPLSWAVVGCPTRFR